jgi:hypothetical protein
VTRIRYRPRGNVVRFPAEAGIFVSLIISILAVVWKVLKCGAGEGWRGSVGPIM